ncbi:SpoIIE family protein phosphatase [Streptomyces sp. NBC_00340]|uniref:PP2C family protein-serine/threonine phosphatase n=1 Tax=Streptomyces sp. NBC_00340 TaxID=2975716 RepID=UPI002252B96D|nr:GAF domain-containing SpoIIE family protein phosphatase [Streptomyces sp. NBC_00340]MCX5136635.1 SpoIIE family protein phosphatase [Streptomyces sp. NBC_00340]
MTDRSTAPTTVIDQLGVSAALEHASAGVYAVADSGRIVWVNARALDLLLLGADDVIGYDSHDLLHRDALGRPVPRENGGLRQQSDRQADRQTDRQALRAGRNWYPRGDGTLLPGQWFSLPCEANEQGVVALVAFHPAEEPKPDAARPAPSPRALSEGERLALLADTTAQLISNVDVHGALRRVVELMLPRLADWAVIDLIAEGDEVTRSLVVQAEDSVLRTREDLQGPMPPIPASSPMPLSAALRGAASALAGPETYDGPPDTGIAVEQRRLFEATGIQTAAIAPIRGPHEVVGALTLGRTRRDEAFTTGDLALVEDIARRIGIALENARHYQRQRQIAATMQRYLLPQLPQLSGVEMTTRYLPAPDASHVGGDWYDAFPLPAGDTALVIGDVVGHDLEAAAGMAQLRNMLRAYTWSQDNPPHRTVQHLDQAMRHITDVRMATLILARLACDPAGHWILRWTSAGHPPPLLVDYDGVTHYLDEGNGLLLGTGTDRPRHDAEATLPPGSTLVFYTDGLIETRGELLDTGLQRLRRHAAALAHRPLNSFTDRLLERTRPTDNDDDVALLTIRIPLGTP